MTDREGATPWRMLAVLTLAQAALSMGAYLWGPLAPFLVAEFGVTAAQVGGLSALFYMVAASVAVPAGLLVDRFGGRLIITACLLTVAAPLLLVAGAPAFGVVLLGAALCGFGNGAINQAGARGVMLWFPGTRRGLAMGIRQTGNMLGGAASAALVPALGAVLGWRYGVLGLVGLLLAVAALSAASYHERIPAPAAAERGQQAESALRRLRRLLGNPMLVTLLVLAPLLGYGQISLMSFFPLYLTRELGFDAVLAGRCLMVALVAAAAGRIFWGWVGDRLFRQRRTLCLALIMLLATLGALAVRQLAGGAPLWVVLVTGAAFAATAMGWHALLLVTLAEVAGAAATGTAFGLLINAAWAGWVVGPLVFGALVDGAGFDAAWATVVASCALCTTALGVLALRARPAPGDGP